MACARLDMPGGGVAIVCGRNVGKVCAGCGSRVIQYVLCDWKVAAGTCDAVACLRCRRHVGEDKDLCAAHARAWEAHPKNPKNAPPAPAAAGGADG